MAVGTVLYDRALERARAGDPGVWVTPGAYEGRGGDDRSAAGVDAWLFAEG